jgi:hypothetical protein
LNISARLCFIKPYEKGEKINECYIGLKIKPNETDISSIWLINWIVLIPVMDVPRTTFVFVT